MILGMPARKVEVASVFSPLRYHSVTSVFGTAFDGGFEWEKPNTAARPMWLLSQKFRDSTDSGRYAVRFAVGLTSPGAPRPPVPGLFYTGDSNDSSFSSYLGSTLQGYGVWVNDDGVLERAYNSSQPKSIGDLTPARLWPLYSEVMLEIDLNTNRVWFGADGNWQTGANPETGVLPTYNLAGFSEVRRRLYLAVDMYYNGGRVRLLRPSEFAVPATPGFTPGWPD